jgi:RHS repeat-associated protein
LATHTDFNGQKESFHYDSLGRVDTKTVYAAGSTTPGETITYHFDSLGRNDTVTDGTGTTTRVTSYAFDLDNRVTSITSPEGTVNYVYDPATGRHTETWTANSDTKYAYDQLGRVQTVTVAKQNGATLGTPLVTTYYYTAVGNIDHITYPNGAETDYGYDTLIRLTSVTNKKGTTVLSSYTYALENDGLRTGVTENQLETDGSTSTVTKTWTYDGLRRLTQEAVTSSITANNYTDNYSFDLVGNRLTKTHAQGGQTLTVIYTYNNNDQLTSESGSGSSTYSTTYGYDINGSLTSVTRTGSGAETDTYGYDLQNRLSSANISRTENGQAVTIAANYTYDDSGPRAQAVVTTTIGNGSPSTTSTQYLLDPNNPTGFSQVLEEHTNAAPSPSLSYLIGLGVFGQTNGSGTTSYLMPDGQVNTRLLTDSSGNITARYAFDAYGNLLFIPIGVLTPPATKILFTGQQLDPNLLRYYLRARYYDSSTGRFNRMDPFAGISTQPQQLNKFVYTHGDPINNADPSGMWEGLVGLGVRISFWATLAVTFLRPAIVAVISAFAGLADALTFGAYVHLHPGVQGQLGGLGGGIGYIGGFELIFASRLKEVALYTWGGIETQLNVALPVASVGGFLERFGHYLESSHSVVGEVGAFEAWLWNLDENSLMNPFIFGGLQLSSGLFVGGEFDWQHEWGIVFGVSTDFKTSLWAIPIGAQFRLGLWNMSKDAMSASAALAEGVFSTLVLERTGLLNGWGVLGTLFNSAFAATWVDLTYGK